MLKINNLTGFGGTKPSWVYLGDGGVASYGSSLVVTVPANIKAGDLLVIAIGNTSSTVSTPAGWTAFTGSTRGFWKIASGSETTVSVTISSGFPTSTVGCCLAYRNVAQTSSTDGAATANSTGTSALSGSITPTNIKDLVVHICTIVQSPTTSISVPDGLITRINVGTGGAFCGLCVADEVYLAAGISLSRTFTISASRTWTAASAAFKARYP